MSKLLKGFLRNFLQPQLQCVRYKNKINITKPRPPNFERHVVEKVCTPYIKLGKKIPQHVPLIESCDAKIGPRDKIESPYAMILAKDLLNWLNHSKLIVIFHKNSLDEEDHFEHAVTLKNAGFKFFTYEKEIVTKAVTGTIYEPILKLFESHTAMAVSVEPNLHKLMNILKNLPLLTLMAGIINNNRLLNYAEMETYGKFVDVESARLLLTSVLTSTSQNLVHQLSHHPNSLVHCLNQIKGSGNSEK